MQLQPIVIKWILAGWMVLGIIPFATAGNGNNGSIQQLNLEQAREFALEHSAAMRTARADLDIAQKQIWETTAIGLPQVEGTLGYQYYLDIPTSLIPAEFFGGEPGEFEEIRFGTEHNLTATATVNQLIFDGQYIVGLRASRIFRELAAQNLKRSELEIINTINETYFLALVAEENLEIVKQNLRNMERTLYETEKMLEEGFTDPINVDQLKLTVSNMKNNISRLERQRRLTLNLLKFQIGMKVETELELTDSLDGLFDELLLEASIAADFDPQAHINYRIMRSQETMDEMVLRREQSSYLPRLSASFTRQEMAMRDEFNFFDRDRSWFPSTYFGVNLNIPIFSSGMRRSQVQQARLELEKSRIAREQTRESLVLQMQEATTDFETSLEQYQNEKENLQLARRILDRTSIMHKEGMASSLELTQANDQLLNTQANYLGAMFDLLNAKNNLKKALGR